MIEILLSGAGLFVMIIGILFGVYGFIWGIVYLHERNPAFAFSIVLLILFFICCLAVAHQ